jgi:hypothetical protein
MSHPGFVLPRRSREIKTPAELASGIMPPVAARLRDRGWA